MTHIFTARQAGSSLSTLAALDCISERFEDSIMALRQTLLVFIMILWRGSPSHTIRPVSLTIRATGMIPRAQFVMKQASARFSQDRL